jgi:hypothetical protein
MFFLNCVIYDCLLRPSHCQYYVLDHLIMGETVKLSVVFLFVVWKKSHLSSHSWWKKKHHRWCTSFLQLLPYCIHSYYHIWLNVSEFQVSTAEIRWSLEQFYEEAPSYNNMPGCLVTLHTNTGIWFLLITAGSIFIKGRVTLWPCHLH